jgi:hypothetical protein
MTQVKLMVLSRLIFFTRVVKNRLAQNSEICANGNFSMLESKIFYGPIGLIPERVFFATFGTVGFTVFSYILALIHKTPYVELPYLPGHKHHRGISTTH